MQRMLVMLESEASPDTERGCYLTHSAVPDAFCRELEGAAHQIPMNVQQSLLLDA